MKQEIVLPEMGESVQEATVVKWHVQIGDMIQEDDTILEVATDKVDSEVPSPFSGKILELCVNEDDVAKIGTVIAYIETESANNDLPEEKIQKPAKNETKKNQSNNYEFALPEMGESVQEATITNWLKSEGDFIKEDENLVEVSTDKVDNEVPSPVSGKIIQINIRENEVAKIGDVLALIETDQIVNNSESDPIKTENKSKQITTTTTQQKIKPIQSASGTNNGFYSPLVKRIAKIEQISNSELSNIEGTGLNKRLTKDDILNYLSAGKAGKTPIPAKQQVTTANVNGNFPHKIDPVTVNYDQDRVTIEAMSTMRKGIAKHMIQSLYTAPHVFSIHEVNMKKIWDWRNKVKGTFKKKYGFNLTFTHIIMEVVAKAIRKNPRINSSIQGDNIIVRHDINMGMAVGYTAKNGDNGLIVPVIKNIDELNLVGIARRAAEFTNKAREARISPDDTAAGTFTVTNVGTFGTEVGLGIINQPQVAILSLGAIVKKAIVTDDDAILVAPTMKMALCYDHRVVDGMLGGNFLQTIQQLLENYQGDDSII